MLHRKAPVKIAIQTQHSLDLRNWSPSKLRAWGIAIARRLGAKRARVAVARKLAVIMHRMWVSGSEFDTGVEKPKMAAA
jgi:hypothetical protein